MKKLFSTLFITFLILGYANAQQVLFSEDFSGGISPALWSNVGSASGGSPSAVKFTPRMNQTAGSGGHYGSTYGTITSPTRATGYITFDSDSLDEGTGTTQGTGPAPAPQHVELTSHAIDVSTHPRVRLDFYQYLANFRATSSVAFSTDSINWTIDTLNADLSANAATDLADEKVTIDLSSIVNGQNNLFIKFIFDGEYYFWALDDINVIELPQNDLSIVSFASQSLTSQGLGLAFAAYPASQIDSITPVAIFRNGGRAAQPNVIADITLKKNNVVSASYSTNPALGSVPAGVDTLDYTTLPVNGIGSYKSIVYVHSDSVDYDVSNNTDSFAFVVNDSVFSINTGSVSSSVYFLLRNNYGLDFRLGTLFEVIHDDTVTSVTTAAIGGSNGGTPPITFTKPGCVLKATIYPVTVGTSLTYSGAVVSTFPVTLTSAQISSNSTVKPIIMKIDNSTGNAVLTPGLYWAAIEAVSTLDSNVALVSTQYQENGFPIGEDFTSPGNIGYFSTTDAVYCNLNFGHAGSLLYADFTRTPGTTPIRAGQPVTFTAITNGSNASTYQWDFTSSPYVGYTYASQTGRTVKDTFMGPDADTIHVCLTVADGGFTAKTCKDVRLRADGVGVHDISALSDVSMVPNPTNGKVTISANGITGATTITITNMIGEEVKHYNETASGSFQKAYNLADLAGGLYVVRIENDGKSVSNRLSITK
ncbi:MAG: protease-associated domain protein [Bacteroidetes bacterium]|nr:protease-associated domain protein [Bacteroidota bacterium]